MDVIKCESRLAGSVAPRAVARCVEDTPGSPDELVLAIEARDAVDVGRFNRKTIEITVRRHLNAWRGLLTKHAHDGRQLLREVLSCPLRFPPEGRTYRFEGQAAMGRLLAGTAGLTTSLVAVRGIEPRFDG
jgi:hypothetical protein